MIEPATEQESPLLGALHRHGQFENIVTGCRFLDGVFVFKLVTESLESRT